MSALALVCAMAVPVAAPIKALADEVEFNPQTDFPGYWVVLELNGKPLPDTDALERSQPMMDFDQTGTFGGNSFCNHFLGDVKIDKQAFTISNFAVTNASCDEPEAELLDVLRHVTSWEATEDGVLLHADKDHSILISNAAN